MPTVENLIPELEDWIEQNQVKGKPATFKVLLHEPDNHENLYTKTIEGTRYGTFAVYYREDDGYYVAHLPTGGGCPTRPFSSEKMAVRYIACISGLANWKEVKWLEAEKHLASHLALLCELAFAYVQGTTTDDHKYLVDTVVNYLPVDEDMYVEAEVVNFGDDEEEEEQVTVQEAIEDDGWGETVS